MASTAAHWVQRSEGYLCGFTSHPNSDYLVQRGIVFNRCFSTFVHDLASRTNRYHPDTDTALATHDRSLGAVGLRSLKRSLDKEDEDRAKTEGVVSRVKEALQGARFRQGDS